TPPRVSSIGLARHPLAEKRVDDDVSIAVARDHVVALERRARGLDGRGAAEAVAGADVRGEELAAVLPHDRPPDGALPQRPPLPERLEHRLLFGEQPTERRVEIVGRGAGPRGAR